MATSYKQQTKRVLAALKPRPTGQELEEAVDALRTLAESSHQGNPEAYHEYQTFLHDLHYGMDEATYTLRQWLASTVYDIEERSIELVEPFNSLSHEAFVKRLKVEQMRLSPLNHPLFQFIFEGEPTFEQAKIYFRQKWLIMLTFWRSLAEFAQRLQRFDLDNTTIVYKNVYDELGEGNVEAAHLKQHCYQLNHIGLPVTFQDTPDYPQTCEYLNYRLMCMRHAEPAWGLGSFFSMEATSLEYTMGHYDLLRKFDVEEEYCQIYEVHEDIDTDHTSEILGVIGNLATTAETQRICLTSQRQQMQLWHLHFDQVFKEVQASQPQKFFCMPARNRYQSAHAN